MSLDEKLRRSAGWIALAVAALMLTGIAGAALGADPLRALRFEAAPMKFDTALALLFAAAALWLHLRPGARRSALFCAGLAAALATITLAESRPGFGRGLDEFIHPLLGQTVAGVAPTRTGYPTALAILVCAAALALLPATPRRRTSLANWLAYGLIAFSLAALIGQALSATAPTLISINLGTHPAAGLLLLGLGLLLARPDQEIARVIFSAEPIGLLVRRMFFGAGFVPLLLGAVTFPLVRQGWLSPTEGIAIFFVGWILNGIVLALATSRLVVSLHGEQERGEQARMLLTARLQEQAAQLQETVGLRSRELHEANLSLRAAAESNARLALVAHHTTNAVIVADAEGRVQWVNAAFERLTGYSLDEMRGQRPGSVLQGPATDPRAQAELHDARVRGEPCHVEVLNYTKDGRAFWVVVDMQPVHDRVGHVVNFVAIQTDITAQRAATAHLRDLNERLRLATRSAALGVWEWDAAARKSTWDDRTLEIFGLTRETYAGDAAEWFERIHPEDRAAARAAFEAITAGANSFELDYRIVRADDDAIRHLQSRAIVQRDADGRLLRVTGTKRDVTPEREAIARTEALNERLRLALRSSKFGVWELDADTNHLIWDDRMFEIYGLTRAEFDGSRDIWRSCVHPEDIRLVLDLTRQVLSGERPTYDTEFRILRPDGTVRHVEAHAYLQRDSDGQALRFVGLNRDITAAKELDDALALAEQRLHLAIEGSNDSVWDWNLETGVLFHDSRWALMLGYEPKELPHTIEGWKSLVHPDDLAANEHAIQDHFAQRTPLYEHELRMRAKTGEWKWILDRGKVVRRSSDGRPLRMAGTHSDVTTRRLLENRLRRVEELSEQVSRLALIGGWEYDLTTDLFTWSDGLRRIHEVDESFQVTLESAFSFYAPEAQDVLRAALDEARLHGSPIDVVVPVTTARGNRRWVRVLGKAEFLNGKPIRLHGAKQDVTLQHESEGTRRSLELQLFQAQKMETLGTLAGGIAHDFNNLLTGIIGYHELAADSLPEDSPARAALTEARNASLRARELVEQILTFGRQSAGVDYGPLDLGVVLEEARRFLRATLPAKVAIELEFAPEASHVLGDATQLHQVLLNLGSNAAHAMRQKGGALKISVAPVDCDAAPDEALASLPPGSYVRLTVSDTGHGMDEDTRRRIFDPFFTTKNTREGTGLGLAVVHGIIRSHRGAIAVASAPGAGTTFTIYLPAATPSDAAFDPGSARPPAGTGELICIVDDEQIVGNCTKLVLENHGYQTLVFTSAEACLAELAAAPQSAAVLITDQTMPGMQGTELIATFRRLRPAFPVVLMSGYFSKISPDILDELGAIELLAKPFTTEELTLAVHRALHAETS